MEITRGNYGEIDSPLPEVIRDLFADFVALQEDSGIERTGTKRRQEWEAVNYDVYGYNEAAHAIVVQRRQSESGKYGIEVSKMYLLVWPGLDGTTVYRYRLPDNASPRRLGDGATPMRVIQWACKKIADENEGERPRLTRNDSRIQIAGDLTRKNFTDEEQHAAALAWDTMLGSIAKPIRRPRAANVEEAA